MNELRKIVDRIGDILKNKDDEPIDMIGSYIVGVTIVRDNIEEYYKEYPLLEKVAELGAELETLGDSKHADEVFGELNIEYEKLKSQIL